MKCKLLILVIVSLFNTTYSLSLFAQKYTLDSLERDLQKVSQRPLQDKESERLKKRISTLLYYFTINKQNNLQPTFEEINELLSKYLNNRDLQYLEAHSYIVMGGSFNRVLEDYPMALYYLQKAESKYQVLKKEYPLGLCYVYTEMAACYYLMKDYNQALEYNNLLEKYGTIAKDSLSLARHWNLGGLIYTELKRYDQAEIFLNKYVAYYRNKPKDGYLFGDGLNNLAEVYQQEKKYFVADSLFRKAINIYESQPNSYNSPFLFETYNDLGQLYLDQGKYREAIYHSLKADCIANKNKNTLKLRYKEEIYRNLAAAYQATGQYDKALYRMQQVDSIASKLYSTEQSKYKNLVDLRVSKEKEQQKASEQRFYYIIYAISGFSIVIVSLIAFALYLRQKSARLLQVRLEFSQLLQERILSELEQAKQTALRAQMNPHFIFNSISSIQNLVLGEQKERAVDYLQHFAKLTRMTLDISDKKSISIREEIEFLKYYTSLEKLRHGDIFEMHIEFSENLDISNEEVPPMITQPFVENAINHGLKHKGERGWIKINFIAPDEINQEYILCEVEDNGIGRAQSEKLKIQRGYQSKSTKIIESRLELMQKNGKEFGSAQAVDWKLNVLIEDKYDTAGNPTGTKVNIYIPV